MCNDVHSKKNTASTSVVAYKHT